MNFTVIALLSLLHFAPAFAGCEDPNKIDVYFVAGQSNAVGTGKVSEIPSSYQAMIPTHKNKLTWNYKTDKLEPLAIGVNNNLLHGWNENFGPEGMIGFRLQNSSDVPFVIFKYAYAGSSLHSDWNSRKDGTYFHSMIANVRKMESHLASLGKSACYQGFFWSQGGSDTGPHDVGDYDDHLRNFISDVRSSLGVSRLPFITARLNRVKDENRFHRQQDKIAKEDDAFRIIETSDLPQDADSIHFNAEGQITFGDRFFTAFLNLKKELENGVPAKNLLVYPVPFSKEGNDELHMKVQNNFYCSKVKVEIIDILGRLVFASREFEVMPGVDSIVDLSSGELTSLASAAYIAVGKLAGCSVVLTESEKQIVKKMIIL